jgi:hypothetical protein
MVQFGDTLEELRNDNLSLANWGFWAQINLSREEIASDAEVALYNHNRLRDSGMPVKRFEAIHKRLETKTANKDQAENGPSG